jgi:hypothetical protein
VRPFFEVNWLKGVAVGEMEQADLLRSSRLSFVVNEEKEEGDGLISVMCKAVV